MDLTYAVNTRATLLLVEEFAAPFDDGLDRTAARYAAVRRLGQGRQTRRSPLSRRRDRHGGSGSPGRRPQTSSTLARGNEA